MLLVAASLPIEFDLPARTFSWLLDDDETFRLIDPSFPRETACQPYTDEEYTERQQHVTSQMSGLTRGLLEMDTERYHHEPFTSPRVVFCHRTARDNLVLNGARRQALHASWPYFANSDVYGRIYLAQLIYVQRRKSYTKWVEINLINHSFCRDFDFNTIRRFETPLLPQLEPLWSPKGDSQLLVSLDQRVAFLQYTAYCGLKDFVLSVISTGDVTQDFVHSPGTSILIAAPMGPDSQSLAIELIERGVGLNRMVETVGVDQRHRNDGKHTMPVLLPSWVVTLASVFEKMALKNYHHKNPITDANPFVSIFRRLHENSVQVEQSVSMVLQLQMQFEVQDGINNDHVDGTVTISSADAVLWIKQQIEPKEGHPKGVSRELMELGGSVLVDLEELLSRSRGGGGSSGGREFSVAALKYDSQWTTYKVESDATLDYNSIAYRIF
jgi:hypothetical protein